MSVRWRAPTYDHGKFGPLGAEVMAKFELVEVPQRLAPGHYAHVGCLCGRFSAACRDEMAKHLAELNHCYVSRTNKFWEARPEFMGAGGTSRLPRIMAESGVEVWRDVIGMTGKALKSKVLGVRVGTTMTAKYHWKAKRWAMGIACSFGQGSGGPIFVGTTDKRWLAANKGDWLLRAVLRRAKYNLEFRSAVTGLQRISSDPWVQYEAFQGWMKNSDTSNTKNM